MSAWPLSCPARRHVRRAGVGVARGRRCTDHHGMPRQHDGGDDDHPHRRLCDDGDADRSRRLHAEWGRIHDQRQQSTGPAHTYTGAVVTNAPGATSMNIENVTITGPATGFPFTLPAPSCNTPYPGLFGIFFNDAGGSVSNVEVLNIFQTNTAPGSPACNTGHAIRADGVTAPRTVTITNTAGQRLSERPACSPPGI